MDKKQLQSLIRNAAAAKADFVIKNANVVNVFTNTVTLTDVAISEGYILGTGRYSSEVEFDAHGAFLTPGLIDGHVHIESSMAHPAGFAECILSQGTTAIVADPHEIGNVCGTDGISYMLEQTKGLPLSVYFMLPSCVPCTSFETSGAVLHADDLMPFTSDDRVLGLGEVMDCGATVSAQEDMLDKLDAFSSFAIDGHAPLLTGNDLDAYIASGVMTDHECSVFEEVEEKLSKGMYIHLRLGSACRGVEDIMRQIAEKGLPTDRMLFCTDDKHLENIQREGHINYILRRAVANGISPVQAVKMATINAAQAYSLKRYGAIAPGYRADLVLFEDLKDFKVLDVFTAGKRFIPGMSEIPARDDRVYDSVRLAKRSSDCLKLKSKTFMPVISLVPGELLTDLSYEKVPSENGLFVPGEGYLKAAVFERHRASGRVGIGILRGMEIRNGAIATTVGHDSHNLIVVGDNDGDMLAAVDALEKCGGGYAVVSGGKLLGGLPMPIAGLMSDMPVEEIIKAQKRMLEAFHSIGSYPDGDPFVTLSFISLPVIPHARITDMGTFCTDTMSFVFGK